MEERLVTGFIDKHKPALPSRPPRSLNTILLHVPWKHLQIRSVLEAKFLRFKFWTVNYPNHSHHVLGPIYKILCLSRAGTGPCADTRTGTSVSSLMHKHSVLISVHYGAVGLHPPLLFLAFFFFFFPVTIQYWQQTLGTARATTSFQHQSWNHPDSDVSPVTPVFTIQMD